MIAEVDYYSSDGLSAVFYDAICQVDPTTKADGAFYAALAPEGGSVLELGCGTGRVTVDLAARGLTVVGVDLAQPMLYRAGLRLARRPVAEQQRVSLAHGDMADIDLNRTFDLVAATYYSLGHVPPDRWDAVFANIERHMAPGAKAAVHLPAPSFMAMPPPKGPEEPVFVLQYGDAGDRLALHVIRQTFEPGGRFEQILDYVLIDGGGREVRRSRERQMYFDEDPRLHAEAAGLVLAQEPVALGSGTAFTFRRA